MAEHTPKWASGKQCCRHCGMTTFVFCPGCRQAEGGEGGAGFYCFNANRDCLGIHHRKCARTPAPGDASEHA